VEGNPTVSKLLAAAQVELDAANHRRDLARAEVAYILEAARQESRSSLTEDEQRKVANARQRRDSARADIEGIKRKIADLKDLESEDADYQARAGQIVPAGEPISSDGSRPLAIPGPTSGPTQADHAAARQRALPAYDQVARVGAEPRTYSPHADPYGRQFLMDVARQFTSGDVHASQRLARHMAEERVERLAGQLERAAGDATTGAFAGLTVPQYLTDLYAPATAGLRPFADVCNHHPLPAQGMAIDISRITTPTSAGLQANEFDAAAAQSIDDTLLTIPVQTIAGQQRMSRQAIDRGTGTEDVTMQDLFSRYATVLDSTLLNQAVTGLSAVATSVAFVSASPTGALLYPKILGACSGVEAALLAMGSPDFAIMHSRRWYWLASQMASTWPLINAMGQGFQYQAGVLDAGSSYNSGVRGRLPVGLAVVVDNNIGTTLGAGTEDELYVVPSRECHLWEEPNAPLYIRAEQPSAANLGVLLVVYGYMAYTFARYTNAIQKVNGTGMIAPVF
jgi:hypothetical protein